MKQEKKYKYRGDLFLTVILFQLTFSIKRLIIKLIRFFIDLSLIYL
jgi:hypothetical protein